LTDAQKQARAIGASVLGTELKKARRRNWDLFSTGDESWIMWVSPPTGWWLELDKELPQKVRQTISTQKSMITIFFNLNSFAIVDALPKGVSFNAVYFVEHIITPLLQRHLAASADIALRKLRVHFDNSPCHTAAIVAQEMQRLRWVQIPHPPYSADLAICDFYLFGRLKQQLRGITVETAEELVDEVTRVFATLSKEELRRAFDHWIERCD
jgi:hypothetical protein